MDDLKILLVGGGIMVVFALTFIIFGFVSVLRSRNKFEEEKEQEPLLDTECGVSFGEYQFRFRILRLVIYDSFLVVRGLYRFIVYYREMERAVSLPCLLGEGEAIEIVFREDVKFPRCVLYAHPSEVRDIVEMINCSIGRGEKGKDCN